ncbi:MAG: LexA family protein [Barnesiella sp.]
MPESCAGLYWRFYRLEQRVDTSSFGNLCARVTGRSMQDCGINDGDLLLVDKSLPPLDGSIAVCFIDGEFTLKRISIRPDGLYLMPANPAYPTLRVAEGSNFQVWGVVSYVIKDMKRG